MGAVKNYFKNIYESVTSIFDGMTITFGYLWQKPVTIQYPNRLKEPVSTTIADRYRGFLQVDYNLCTSCEACAKACPIGCITLDGVKIPDKKGKAPYFFYINMAKCMYCGLCIEPCPTDAIFFTKEFEGSYADQKDLVFSYVPEDVSKDFLDKARKLEEEKAAKKAAEQKKTEGEGQ